MFPDDRFVICSAKVITSKPLSKITDRSTALTRSCSLPGLVSVPTDRILSAAPRRKACCRLTRSRSPSGSSVPLTDERQRRGALHVLLAGREVRPGPGVVHRRVQADRDAADGVGQQVEAEQVHLGVVIDLQAGERLEHADEHGPAGLVGLPLDLRLVSDTLVDQVFLGVRLRGGVERVDLVRLVGPLGAVCVGTDDLVRHPGADPGVPGNRHGGRPPATLRHVHDHDGVGVDAAAVVLGADLSEFLGGQRVAVRVGARIRPDEQEGQPFRGDHAGVTGVLGGVGRAAGRLQFVGEGVGRAGADEDGRGDHRRDDSGDQQQESIAASAATVPAATESTAPGATPRRVDRWHRSAEVRRHVGGHRPVAGGWISGRRIAGHLAGRRRGRLGPRLLRRLIRLTAGVPAGRPGRPPFPRVGAVRRSADTLVPRSIPGRLVRGTRGARPVPAGAPPRIRSIRVRHATALHHP